MAGEYRAVFDAEIVFVNGGGLRTEGFRLDVPGPEIDDVTLGTLLVRHLGLLMVGEVRISNKTVVEEPHKGGRGVAVPVGDGSRRLVELSHVITDGMTTLTGWPAPRITDWLTREASRANYAPGVEFHVGRIDMIANTGTYLDAPAHRWADGADLAGTPLDHLADLPGIVVRVPAGTRAVDRLLLAPYDVAGRAVLLHTGWDAHFGTDRYAGHDAPHLTGLAALPPEGFRFTAVPPRVAGMGTFPVRAFAVVD